METINKAAYWDYQRERVYVKSRHKSKRTLRATSMGPRSMLTPNATIEYSRPSSCPTCKSKIVYTHGKRSKTVIDLRFHAVWNKAVDHSLHRPSIPMPIMSKHLSIRLIDAGPPANTVRISSRITIYQNIELRLPQSRVASSVNKLFGLTHLTQHDEQIQGRGGAVLTSAPTTIS